VRDPADLTIAAAREQMAAGRLSVAELVDAVLARIEARGEELNTYLHVDAEGARRQARRPGDGPLGGIPLCVKDVIDVAGMPTTAGAAGWTRRPAADAPVVARLRRAGAVIVGKGHTNEFAYGIDGRNPHRGDAANPHDPARITGGSTSGPAAATAAGLALAGVGTDTSGSLRVPASLCGVVALRPTLGALPRRGVVPLAWSYDAVGPVARSAGDAALLLGVMRGDPIEADVDAAGGRAGRPLDGMRIGVADALVAEGCESYVAAGVNRALSLLSDLGAEVAPARFELLSRATAVHRIVQMAEAASIHGPWFAEQAVRYAPDVRERLEVGRLIPARDYLDAQRARRLVVDEVRAVMEAERLDALAAPTTPAVAFPRHAEEIEVAGRMVPLRAALQSLTVPLTESGGPVLAMPIGTHEGLPFGLQLAARPGAEPRLLAIAAAYEAATAGA
jgi:aspartyl-tRNA(Asn)/glutamyl-tRNA(Gln) amidotransferase subunit A